MARPSGSKVIDCPKKRCTGKIVALVGEHGTCIHCNTKVWFTKKRMRELGKKI